MPLEKLIVNDKWFMVLTVALSFFVFTLITSRYAQVTAQSPSPSQASTLDKAQADYNFQYALYNETHTSYKTAKAQYLSFQTAVSKNDAFTKTKDYLVQVDNLYLSFFALVQENANNINWEQSTQQSQLVTDLLKGESDYFKAHIQSLQNTKTLEELPPLSKDLKKHIEDTTQPKLNKVIAILTVAQTESSLSDFNSLSAILDRVVVFKLRAGETKSILANWSSEIKDIKDKTNTGLDQAKEELSKNPQETMSEGNLDNVSQNTQKAQTELKRSKALFEELIRIL